jgi:hypothetical protein
MKNIEKIKTLRRASHLLATLRPKYLEKIKDSSCDKHDMKFGGDDRFSVFKCTVFLDCHTGYYGNSSCSSMGGVDNVIAQELLNRALNKMMPQVLEEMAKQADLAAQKLTIDAQAEIDSLQAEIDAAKAAIES